MPLNASGAFGVVIQGAVQVAQAVRDQFAQRTNADTSRRLPASAAVGGNNSSTPQGLPWNAETVFDFFDLTTVNVAASGFQGMAFNGRDLYFVPYGVPGANAGALLVAYNTTLPFTNPASYQSVSLTAITGNSQARNFLGGVVDAQGFLYLIPNYGGAGAAASGLVVRFDTSKLLSDTTAYSTFDVTTLSVGGIHPSGGFAWGCCDGRWLYLCPSSGGTFTSQTPNGWAVRYDTTQAFANSASWQAVNIPNLFGGDQDLTEFQTCITDGQFVYYAPFNNRSFAQYNTSLPFTSSASWQIFDSADLIGARGFTGASRIGRYIFFTPWRYFPVPGSTQVTYESVMARFDTADPRGLTNVASWATLDLQSVPTNNSHAQGYQGSISDGVYLYLIPTYNGPASQGGTGQPPPFLRYDTRKEFTDKSAWVSLSGTNTPAALNLLSTDGASDGVYGYNCPYELSTLVLSGTVYRWRLWPGQPDTPLCVGMSRDFWLDSSGKTGFATKAPVEQVHAGTFLSNLGATVRTNVRADGLLLGQMGASGVVAPAPVSATVSTAASNSQGATATTLVTYTLPASAFSAPNKGVRLTAFGSYAGNANPKQVRAYLGGTQIAASSTVSITGGSWYLRASVFDQGSHVQRGGGTVISASAPIAAAVPWAMSGTPGATEANPISIAITGQGSMTNDVTLSGFVVEFLNANNS